MRDAFFLAYRYMAFDRIRTAILVICTSLAIFLPLAVHVLVGYYNRHMIERAQSTPLVVGAKGSVYDLVLGTVYFKGRLEELLSMEQVEEIRQSDLALPVPIYVRFTTGGQPIVGTTIDYFDFRGLTPHEGTLPQILGDVVVGSAAARRLDVSVGEKLLTDDEKLYDISSTYPLLLRVTGILEPTGTADDLAVFADIKTAWIIEGIGHGHAAAREIDDPTKFRAIGEGNVVMSGAVVQYNEIRPEDLDAFHFHGDDASFPISAVIALPHDTKSATILSARYRLDEKVQAVVPRRVVAEMMEIVFRVKRLFDVVFLVVLISTCLFLILVMLLSLRIRQREFATLHKIGCRRATVAAMQACEVLLLFLISGSVAGVTLGFLCWYVVRFDVLL